MSTKPEFSFRTPTDVMLKHVNHRKQFSGPDQVQGIDLDFWIDRPNTFLDTLLPGLREALYCNHTADAGQTPLDGIDAPLPNLRFPKLNGGAHTVMTKKDAFAGYELAVSFGLGDEVSNMLFDCCKVKVQKVETKEGGTVRVFFQVSYGGDRADGGTIGKLIEQEGGEVTIQLIPPAIEVVEEEERLTPEDVFGPGASDREPDLTAEDIFASTAEPDDTALADSDMDAR